MNKGKDDYDNTVSDDELELKRFVEKGNKLKWTWIIGILVIIFCIIYGDTAQWLFAGVVACYILITTVNYFKTFSS